MIFVYFNPFMKKGDVITVYLGKVYYTNNHYETFTDITEKLKTGK